MAETGKKIEVRLGAFACSIEGYDNPVEQMREVLAMVQQMVAETPQLAEQAGSFNAEEVESALIAQGTEADVKPGLVVMRAAETDDDAPSKAATAQPAEEVTEPAAFADMESPAEDLDIVAMAVDAADDLTNAPVADVMEDDVVGEANDAAWDTDDLVEARADTNADDDLEVETELADLVDFGGTDFEPTETSAEAVEIEAVELDTPDVEARETDPAEPLTAEISEEPESEPEETIEAAEDIATDPVIALRSAEEDEYAAASDDPAIEPLEDIASEAEDINEAIPDAPAEEAEVIHLHAPEGPAFAPEEPVLTPDQAIRQAVMEENALAADDVSDTQTEADIVEAAQEDNAEAETSTDTNAPWERDALKAALAAGAGDTAEAPEERAAPEEVAPQADTDAPWERDALKAALAAGVGATGAAVASQFSGDDEPEAPDTNTTEFAEPEVDAPEVAELDVSDADVVAPAASSADENVDFRDAIMAQIRGTTGTDETDTADTEAVAEALDKAETPPDVAPVPDVESYEADPAEIVDAVPEAEQIDEAEVVEEVDASPFRPKPSSPAPAAGPSENPAPAPIQPDPEPVVMPEVAAAAAAEPAPAFNIFAAPAANAAQAVSGIAQAAANTGQAVQVDILPPDFEETPDEAEYNEPQNPSPFEKDAGFDEGAEQSSASRPAFSMPVDDGRDAPSADWRLDLMRRIRDEGPEAEAGETIRADDAEITNEVRPVTPVEPAPADDAPVNIFAAPRPADPSPRPRPNPEVETPRTIENAPASAAPQARDDSPGRSRFDALLSRIQEGPKVNAPAEEPRADLSPLDSDGSAISAVELANLSKASSVADLLAASAAWLTLVKGSGRFSRREVMQVFDDLPGDHPKTLEARIKGYGKLVRSGTLMLVDDGVFAMAQSARDDYQMLLDQR